MGKKSEYVIGFTSLRDGKHEFQYKVENTFFEQFDYSDIEGADLKLKVVLEKKPTMILVDFDVAGSLTVMCDRCTDSFDYPVSGQDDIIYKFAEHDLDDEKVIGILPHETEIDITIPVYEFVSLLLPSRRIHPEGECNEEMLKEIDNYLMVETDDVDANPTDDGEDDEIDPRWSQLKNLK